MPLERRNNLTSMAIGRLKDKSSIVRKNAVVLLTKVFFIYLGFKLTLADVRIQSIRSRAQTLRYESKTR